jgi:hypothetical protein
MPRVWVDLDVLKDGIVACLLELAGLANTAAVAR